jgi:hypothetical protein
MAVMVANMNNNGANKKAWRIDGITKFVIPIAGVLISAAGLWIAYSQYPIAQNEHAMAELVQPVVYTVSYQDAGTLYEISNNGNMIAIPALEPNVKIESGVLKFITALQYDGEALSLLSHLDISPDWEADSVTIKAQIGENPLVADGIFYDYLFLYMEPIEGEPILDLVYAEVDLSAKAVVRTRICHRDGLLALALDQTLSYAERYMLEAYEKLTGEIAELNSRTAT